MAGPPSALPPLTGPRLALIAIALAIGTFMVVLDSTIANVSLPTIAGNIGVASFVFGTAQSSWWVAGLVGAAMSLVWNYAASSIVTWRRG